MGSQLSSMYDYFFNQNDEEEYFMNEVKHLRLELEKEKYLSEVEEYQVESNQEPNEPTCFQKTGVITYIGDHFVLIDGSINYDTSNCWYNLKVNDKIIYFGYYDSKKKLNVVRILENQGTVWGEEESDEERFDMICHTIVGKVEHRVGRYVHIEGGDLIFNLDDVQGSFIPIQGDWLEMQCVVQKNHKKPTNITTNQVLEVKQFNPVRTKTKQALITEWSGTEGSLDKQIFINSNTIIDNVMPQVGSKVLVRAIESTQGNYSWRGLELAVVKSHVVSTKVLEIHDEEQKSLDVEKEKNITMTYPLRFSNVNISSSDALTLSITNNSNQRYVLNKWIMLSKKRDSQVFITPFINEPKQLWPLETLEFAIKCEPKFLGKTKECLVIQFRGFQLKRFIEIDIVDSFPATPRNNMVGHSVHPSELEKRMRNVRQTADNHYIYGVRPAKTPHFVEKKIGLYAIPEKIWSVVLGDSEQTMHSGDFDKIIQAITQQLPCLVQHPSIVNYCDKWHTLLYMEEIQGNINVRVYDNSKMSLRKYDDYLALEINGLSERRPSLIMGDKVIVKQIWDRDGATYEGYIHQIKGEVLLIKFANQFHENYGGADVSVEFHLNRSSFRRAHHAITNVFTSLGPDVLFPSKIKLKTPQIPMEVLENLKWYNSKLNDGQKQAVVNILKGESRPLPYIIFGPPGTGKTVTVIETVLQILKNIPDSRILIATPSNSASNLITERLVEYRKEFSNSVIRLIASYLIDSDSISDSIKPYTATVDVSMERTSGRKHHIKNDINVNCKKSYVGRHRVTIATCNCIGSLFYMNFPKGHFTHIIVDEAGQAHEPEIMIPLSFTDKDNGQIILAGDPMQLGPVVISKYCVELGMADSFLCRLLTFYPYQKDYDTYKCGFDDRVVTKLTENYRSVQEVLSLPSEMFYEGTLVPRLDKNQKWISTMIDATCEIFNVTENKSGGIYVYGIQGENVRAVDSPSWYNIHEASMVALSTNKLYRNGVKPDDIGIISPYIAQVRYLRLIFDGMGLAKPKIGTVEEFQGQEKPIILISTVRSSESLVPNDIKFKLGFVDHPNRVNVALTRAHVSVILFCNPHLLCIDSVWSKIIQDAVKNNKYMGCNLPNMFQSTTFFE